MKFRRPLTCSLSLLTLCTTVTAQPPAAPPAATDTALPVPAIASRGYYSLNKDDDLRIDFAVPMIPAEEVGQPVKDGYFTISYPDCCKATWISTTRIQLEITKELPPLEIVRVEVPAGLRSLKGEILPGNSREFPTLMGTIVSCGVCSNGNLLLRAARPEYKEALHTRLSSLCYVCSDTCNERHPLHYRPATVADALADWDAFDAACNYDLSLHDREELSTHPADEVIPDTWVVESPGIAPQGSTVKILLPNGTWDSEARRIGDYQLTTIDAPDIVLTLSNNCTARGHYAVKLELGMPSSAADAAALISGLSWQMREDAHSDQWVPLEWKDGALRGKIRGKDITITPTATENGAVNLIGQGQMQGIQSVTLTAETGGREIRLRVKGAYPAISTPGDTAPGEDYTMLRPRTPFIYTDVNANHMQLRGSTTLRCRYGQLENGTARVWKLAADKPADIVRLLRDYNTLYTGQEMHWRSHEQQAEAREAAQLSEDKIEHNRVDTSALPGVIATAERPLEQGAENELHLPLAELFAGQPVGGFYFVNIEGTPIRESKTPLVNQGLIQVTDLGLMWKTDGRHLLAWAYHLSTAQEVQAATLRLLDAEGTLLAELPVKNGLAEGDFNPATRYLQLSTADDCVTLSHSVSDMEFHAHMGDTWELSKMLKNGGVPATKPTPMVYLFSNRSLYRPGETAHVKGIARNLVNNELLTPEIETVTATVSKNYREVATLPATLQQDGTFTIDLPLSEVGDFRVEFNVTFKNEAKPQNSEEDEDDEDDDSSFSINLSCQEFRRNEFEVKSTLNVQPAEHRVEISATATNLTTTPVAHGKVNWYLLSAGRNFYPSQSEWADFRFGDFRENPWEFFMCRYYGRSHSSDYRPLSQEGTLDAEGKGSATFTLPAQSFPLQRIITATTTVTNGNEQSIKSVQTTTLHPADVYAGIRPHVSMAQVGGTLPVDLVAVRPDGSAWDGTPLEVTVTATRTVFRPYRYGSRFSSSVVNSQESIITHTIPTTLTGTPSTIQVPVDKAGRYDITVSGRDAQGREFRSATRHYVWGDEESPWEHHDFYAVELVADKPLYHPGDTARVLVQTPVDAELLVTVERERVLRHYRRKVSVDKPIIEIPIEATDGPVVYLSVSLVQSDNRRSGDGKPQIKVGTCQLVVACPEKELRVQLQAPPHSLRPGESCTVSGTITDAAGNPVPHADVALYAEDEGTLQVKGYKLPNPALYFYGADGRPHGVGTFSALDHLLSSQFSKRDFGNKGVFIGGGDDDEYESEEEEGENEEQIARMREDFNPTALWLSNVRTDDKGNFTATYSNPDTLTRYRLMAVAAAGDKFGSAQTAYLVNKPVMLEPVAPMSAVEGDELLLPVTVSMLPDSLPEAQNNQSIDWSVSISGTNTDLPQPTKSLTLTGNKPVTIHFPVKMKSTGPVQLQWRVQPVSAPQGSELSHAKDAVQLSFNATPPTPHLREYVWTELRNGQSSSTAKWLRNPYRADGSLQLSFSTSPLSGLGYPLQYLFSYPYGCTEQLSSMVLPWLLKEPLQQTLGVQYPADKDAEKIAEEVNKKLQNRRLAPGRYGYWDGDRESCEFSAYAVMIRAFMNGLEAEETVNDMNGLAEQIRADEGNTYLNLLVLSIMNTDVKELFDIVYERAQKEPKALSSQRLWLLATTASSIKHPAAEELTRRAKESDRKLSYDYALPPVDILQVMHAIECGADDTATVRMLSELLQKSAGQYSTWRNGWITLLVSAYSIESGQADKKSDVNGTAITPATPMHLQLSTGNTEHYSVKGDTVYVSGYAEGYLTTQQPEQAIDKGFAVHRRYERLLPDGSWQPTGTFTVGDIVRVTVSATAGKDVSNLRYIALEDRLPATFEAINPDLTSQGLPEGISAETCRSWYYFPSSVNNREFLKDRVRMFAGNLWGSSRLEFSYVARVVRSGKVTAPAAKAELMYRPEVYGLSIPQQFEVKPGLRSQGK